MDGGPDNPLGARAMYLFQGGRDTLYRIHGTNEPQSIGKAVSSGCIRMLNADVIDLYGRVPVGTKVVVLSGKSDRAARTGDQRSGCAGGRSAPHAGEPPACGVWRQDVRRLASRRKFPRLDKPHLVAAGNHRGVTSAPVGTVPGPGAVPGQRLRQISEVKAIAPHDSGDRIVAAIVKVQDFVGSADIEVHPIRTR